MTARSPITRIAPKTLDVERARAVLFRVEKEIADDWRYADYQQEALDDIKELASVLRGVLCLGGATQSAPFVAGRTKLTDEQVAEIRRRYVEEGVLQQVLADEYAVSQTAISGIVLYKTRHKKRPTLGVDHRKKLTNKQVAEIRRRYRKGGVTQQALAAAYGVAQAAISQIVRNKVRTDGPRTKHHTEPGRQ